MNTATVLWRRLDHPGHEIARVAPANGGFELSGTAVLAYEGSPCVLQYRVKCDHRWHTVAAEVAGHIASRRVDIRVAVDPERRWQLNGQDAPAVEGCFDIDLGFSPSTNMLPIRRLALAVGEEAEVRAAWLPFPALQFEVLPQVYRREGESTYRYESNGGRFVRTLEVNDFGMVTSYPGLWEKEASSDSAPPE
jgi:hypothetical protein